MDLERDGRCAVWDAWRDGDWEKDAREDERSGYGSALQDGEHVMHLARPGERVQGLTALWCGRRHAVLLLLPEGSAGMLLEQARELAENLDSDASTAGWQ